MNKFLDRFTENLRKKLKHNLEFFKQTGAPFDDYSKGVHIKT